MLLEAHLLFASHFLIFLKGDSAGQSYEGVLILDFQVTERGTGRCATSRKIQGAMYVHTSTYSSFGFACVDQAFWG